MSPLKDNIVRR